ncbi:YhfC family intramembrane metalloprotease [Raineyella sp.]|uniref:YhfC family intramembrane metalloprotease n=1 Tax=bioreactor metagenome TaxID=1076179 RepID=A0A644Z6A6_9ZZZZ|nr:YhfC family glutamic-type intramembrane protease [Raineyella sp.]MEA5153183.1 YhfC family glutamic-type intramembrane protease [Raineyella sp.]
MVPVASLVFLVVDVIICFGIPLGGLAWLATRRTPDGAARYPAVGRAFLCGMLAFAASQLLTRLPLMAVVVPQLPHPVAAFLLSGPVASYTAGLFEETGRLVVMVLLLRRFHRWVDGVAFGLGHGGLEAMALVGLTFVSDLVIAVMINTGGWSSLAAALPADRAQQIRDVMTGTAPTTFLAGGVERIGAIGVHVALSVLVLWGVHRSRKLLAWVLAVVLHGTVNLTAVLLAGAKVNLWWIELAVLVLAAALLALAVRLRPAFAMQVAPDLRRMPPPVPPV